MKKAEIKKLEKALKHQPRLVWDALKPDQRPELDERARDYKAFLDAAKTEREAVREITARAEKAGFKPLDSDGRSGRRVYAAFMDKVMVLAVTGRRPSSEGLRLIVSHIDAPRLDLKPRPLYEDVNLAFLKTHYYGGIKKYQWMSRPLALHGRVVKADGRMVDVVVGEDRDDPVLTISDLLPHLAGKVQGDKKVSEAFPGEKLNLVVGSLPLGDEEVKERFKLAILDLMHRRWGLIEEDLISAEFEVVPAGPARDVGLDGALIGAYGQDDRMCAYTSLAAILALKDPEYTCVALYVDKEETGSDGATGARSRYLESFLADLMAARGETPSSAALRQTLIETRAISADVNGALDPDYQEVHEKYNAARLGYGPCVSKYTGSRGKYGASDASAEYMGWLRGVFNRNDIVWQSGLMGKVDEGGGGTVAMFLAQYGMQIVDCGPSVLNVHSPFEISSKADLYMTVRAYQAFYRA
ncbi:MAG: aminopeptidase [Proteobacteria bacterium]|nr:aminopeptidase [Pseudomonadota bacterium]